MELLEDNILRSLIKDEWVIAHRKRALTPDHPIIRGTAQNPDVYFQARETVNPFYRAYPEILQKAMDKFAQLTGRQYHLFDYHGDPKAERVFILMGSGFKTVHETVIYLLNQGEKIIVLKFRLYRLFERQKLIKALPKKQF